MSLQLVPHDDVLCEHVHRTKITNYEHAVSLFQKAPRKHSCFAGHVRREIAAPIRAESAQFQIRCVDEHSPVK